MMFTDSLGNSYREIWLPSCRFVSPAVFLLHLPGTLDPVHRTRYTRPGTLDHNLKVFYPLHDKTVLLLSKMDILLVNISIDMTFNLAKL